MSNEIKAKEEEKGEEDSLTLRDLCRDNFVTLGEFWKQKDRVVERERYDRENKEENKEENNSTYHKLH